MEQLSYFFVANFHLQDYKNNWTEERKEGKSYKRQLRNILEIGVSIYDHTGELCTSAVCVYFTFPQKRAYEEFGFREFLLEDEA